MTERQRLERRVQKLKVDVAFFKASRDEWMDAEAKATARAEHAEAKLAEVEKELAIAKRLNGKLMDDTTAAEMRARQAEAELDEMSRAYSRELRADLTKSKASLLEQLGKQVQRAQRAERET